MRQCLTVLAIAWTVGCAQVPPERKAVDDAAAALGGKDRLLAAKTLTIEGGGSAPNVGQNRMPDDELPVWKVTEYRRTIDLANARMRIQQRREAQFLFAGDLDPAADAAARRRCRLQRRAGWQGGAPGDAAVRDRRIEMLHHPIAIIRAALDPAARLANRPAATREQLVDITTARGDVLTLAIDSATKLPTRVISMAGNPNMGDVTIVTTFSDYEDVNGLKLPRRLTTKMDKYLQFDLQVTKNMIDGDAGDLAAPEAVKAAPRAGAAARSS